MKIATLENFDAVALKVAGINNMSSNVNPSMTTLSAINDIELMP